MSRTWIRPALAVLIVGAVAAPALAHVPPPPGGGCRLIRGAETPDITTDDVSVCRQDVYFHKATSASLGNLAGSGQVALPSWNTTKPTGGLHEAGVYVSSSEYDIFVEEGGATGRAQFRGTFTGALDTLAFRLFLRSPFNEVADGGALPATVSLEIDGQEAFDNYDTAAIDLPISGSEEGVGRIDVTFHKLYQHMQALDLDLSPTKEHTIKVGIAGWFFPGSETVFLYDADEAQSGIFFNLEPTSMSGFTKIDPTAT